MSSSFTKKRHLREIRRLLSRKDYEGVASACSTALELYPEEAEVFYLRALSHSALNKMEEALLDVSRAIELFPREPAFYYFRALWRTNANCLSEAAGDFHEVIRLEEALGSVYYIDSARMGLAVTRFLSGDLEHARSIIEAVPADAEIFVAQRPWTPEMLSG